MTVTEQMASLSQQTLSQLKTGAFLTVGEETPNTMTIGWGSLSIYWGKPIFIVPVRYSRYSYGLLNNTDNFTVSVPYGDDEHMKTALRICGSKSGRDTDKYALAGLQTKKATLVNTPVIKGCSCYFECKVLYTTDFDLNTMPDEIKNACYPNGDAHRLYFAEIVACYKGDK